MQPSWKPWARGSREHVWKKRDSELICQEVTILKVRNIRGTNRSGRSCYDMEETPRYSNCGPGTSSHSLTMELLGNVKSQAVQTPWIQNLHPQVICVHAAVWEALTEQQQQTPDGKPQSQTWWLADVPRASRWCKEWSTFVGLLWLIKETVKILPIDGWKLKNFQAKAMCARKV